MKRLIVVTGIVLLFTALEAAGQAALGEFTYVSDYSTGATKGYVAVLDLKAASFQPEVTGQDPECLSKSTTLYETTRKFADDQKTFVTITANTGLGGRPPCHLADGIVISNGEVVNDPADPGLVLYFTSNGEAFITDGLLPPFSEIQNAVAGTAVPEPGCTAGTLLVKDGKPQRCALPKPFIGAPRGAIGLDESRRHLIIVVIDGDECSDLGLMTYDYALLLLAFGANDAVNFDGGGNAVFYWHPDAGIPAGCDACQLRIRDAAIPTAFSNPYHVSFKDGPKLLRMDRAINDANQVRNVYASIGFRLLKRNP
jgi:exopolysaccharide biosynthesis protein